MFAELISAGANLLGGLLNRNSQEKFNEQQIALGRENIALQKEFAQHGISWKVDDAKSAGLHPLAALGAQTNAFSPVSVGGEAPKMDFGSLGQDLSRAAKAMSTAEQRRLVDEERERKLDIESKALDNDLKRSTLGSRVLSTSRNGGQLGPPMPSADMPGNWQTMVSGGPRRADGVAVADDDMKSKAASTPGVRSLNLWGVYPFKTNPNIATGQDLEDVGGEYGGGVMSLPNIPAHIIWDLWNNKIPDYYKGRGRSAPRTFPYYR